MDVTQIMERLADMSDAELTEALAAVTEQASELRGQATTEENVTKLETLAAARKAVKDEKKKRQQLAERADAVNAEFADDEKVESKKKDDGKKGEDKGAEEGAEGEEQGGTAGESTNAAGDQNPGVPSPDEGVQAAAKRPLGTLAKKPETATQFAGQVRTKTIVNGEVAGRAMGSELDMDGLTKAMLDKFHAIRQAGNGRYDVARVEFSFPEERTLSGTNAEANTERIAKANPQEVAERGLTAALCGPLEPIYDINVLGVTARPVRDALTRFGVDRGGIQYRQPFDALNMTTGMGIWTPADDDAVVIGPTPAGPRKTCLEVDCPGVVEASLYATYLCLQFPNFTARFDQEWVTATTRASLVAWARFAENELLKRLLAGSKQLTAPVSVSATRDLLANIDKVTAYYRYRHRLDTMVPLRLILPRWVLDMLRADLTRGFSGNLDALRVADATIEQFLAARGVRVTWHLDGLDNGTYTIPDVTPTQSVTITQQQIYDNAAAASAIPVFIPTVEGLLFAEGDWLFLDGGTLDLGLVRDSSLNAANRYQTFVENFEGVAFNGIESLRLTMNLQPRGAVVGTLDPMDYNATLDTYPAPTP